MPPSLLVHLQNTLSVSHAKTGVRARNAFPDLTNYGIVKIAYYFFLTFPVSSSNAYGAFFYVYGMVTTLLILENPPS